MKQIFNTNDAPSQKFAEFYCTIGDRRYNMFCAKNFEATASVSNVDVPRLGSVIKGKKPNGLEIKLTFTMYKVSEMFDDLITEFKKSGFMPSFECQVTSEDGGTSIGRSTKVYRNCVLDGDVLLSAFDADGDLIEQSITAYALDYDSAEQYEEPMYM